MSRGPETQPERRVCGARRMNAAKLDKVLAEWWHDLNEWRWPAELRRPADGLLTQVHMRGAFEVVERLIELRKKTVRRG